VLKEMTGYDARFWELPFDPDTLANVPADLFAATGDEISSEGARLRRRVLDELAQVVRTRLTARQREIVELYFFAGRTQQEIAAELGVSQQAVSRQLFGVVRDGRRVGGAITRLRRIAVEQGWDPSEWV
jgi:DNA-directed RNA polymerase specialized sigma24 family protein